MKITDETIGAAFERHHERYAREGSKAWDITGHVEYWRLAHQAFVDYSFDKFKELYEGLRRGWQVFRSSSGKAPWPVERTWDELKKTSQAWRRKRLSELRHPDAQPCLAWLETFKSIKPLKDDAVSVVAVSKFLHFWNPRLFVIVDRGVMWQWVFQHDWLWQQVVAFAPSWLRPKLAEPAETCDLPRYLAILLWSSDVIRDNPAIIEHFVTYVRNHGGDAGCDLPLETYEAAAMEWLLLGLTELPPGGVSELS